MAATQKINFFTLFPIHSFRQFFARTYHFATIQNVTDRRQTHDRQTTQCTKSSTDSTMGQKSNQYCNVIKYRYQILTLHKNTIILKTDTDLKHEHRPTTSHGLPTFELQLRLLLAVALVDFITTAQCLPCSSIKVRLHQSQLTLATS